MSCTENKSWYIGQTIVGRFYKLLKKKLVTRLPNFPDRMIRYGSFFSKYIVKNKFRIFKFFKGGGRGRGSFFIILRYLKQLLLGKPCAILYLFKDRVANSTPLNQFFLKYHRIFKKFCEKFFVNFIFLNYLETGVVLGKNFFG